MAEQVEAISSDQADDNKDAVAKAEEQRALDDKEDFVPFVDQGRPEEGDEEGDEATEEPGTGGKPVATVKSEQVDDKTGTETAGAKPFKLEAPFVPPATELPKGRTLVHLGQDYFIAPEQEDDLLRQGLDYTRKLGRHSRLINLVENDPALALKINDHLSGGLETPQAQPAVKAEFKVSAFGDDASPEEWLQSNLGTLRSQIESDVRNELVAQQRSATPQPPAAPPEMAYLQMLSSRDPAHSSHVLSVMPKYETQISVGDYKAIVADQTGARLCQFYDWVKEQELAATQLPASNASAATAAPKARAQGFRLKSSGAQQEAKDQMFSKFDKLSNDDFDALVERVKYGNVK